MNEPDLRAWVVGELGGELTAFERVGSGASRATFLVAIDRGGDTVEAVLRVDSGDGPTSGTELTLARESAVYRALVETGVRAPRLIACRDDASALLMERAPGTDAFALALEASRRGIAIDYMAALAVLHGLDTEAMALPGFERPELPSECARPDLRLWRRIYDERAPESDPLLQFACDRLEDHAPVDAARVSLCHGDAGPGNFLFEGERVTALLDWEFAHLGDPLDDIAWISVRSHLLGGFGDWKANLAAWEAQTGLRADAHRIEYYRALVLVRMAISCQAALAHTGARTMQTAVYEMLLPYLHFLIPQALRLAGCDAVELDEFEREAAAGIEASPVLQEHARPLEALEA